VGRVFCAAVEGSGGYVRGWGFVLFFVSVIRGFWRGEAFFSVFRSEQSVVNFFLGQHQGRSPHGHPSPRFLPSPCPRTLRILFVGANTTNPLFVPGRYLSSCLPSSRMTWTGTLDRYHGCHLPSPPNFRRHPGSYKDVFFFPAHIPLYLTNQRPPAVQSLFFFAPARGP